MLQNRKACLAYHCFYFLRAIPMVGMAVSCPVPALVDLVWCVSVTVVSCRLGACRRDRELEKSASCSMALPPQRVSRCSFSCGMDTSFYFAPYSRKNFYLTSKNWIQDLSYPWPFCWYLGSYAWHVLGARGKVSTDICCNRINFVDNSRECISVYRLSLLDSASMAFGQRRKRRCPGSRWLYSAWWAPGWGCGWPGGGRSGEAVMPGRGGGCCCRGWAGKPKPGRRWPGRGSVGGSWTR